MATIAYPNLTHFVPDKFEWGLRTNVMVSTSSHNGAVQTIEMPGARWVASMSWDSPQKAELQAEIEAFWANVGGQINRVSLWHIRRPTPRGTLQSNVTFNGTHSIGSSTLSINATTGLTLKQGDMVGASGNQLFMVLADATASSNLLTVTVAPKVRATITGGSACTVVRPSALFMLTQQEVRIPYEGYVGTGFGLDLVEVYA